MRSPRPSDPRVCSIDAATKIIGERWALVALREITFGVHRFDDIVFNTGAPRDILAKRLKTLAQAEVIERVLYEQRPPRYEYRLSEAGTKLFGVLHAIRDWGDQYARKDSDNVMIFQHSCGAQLLTEVRCQACGKVLEKDNVLDLRGVHRSGLTDGLGSPGVRGIAADGIGVGGDAVVEVAKG
jgi:DNA-binding HxlR family transcriptional regulator